MRRTIFAPAARALVSLAIMVCAGMSGSTSARAGVMSGCAGDCDDNGMVTTADIIVGVNILLGRQPISVCTVLDVDGDEQVTVDELIRAVKSALEGCVAVPTPTVTPSPTATPVGNPTGLTVAIEDDLVRLRWMPPDPASGNTRFLVLRRLNAAVEGPLDPQATEVFFGPTDTAFDEVAALLPDLPGTARIYSFAVHGCSGVTRDSCESVGSTATLTPRLTQTLHAGGYTIWWRHADASICADLTCLGTAENTSTPNWWKSCDNVCPDVGMCPNQGGTATARQLNADGVAHATAIGDTFDMLGLPVGRVVSSEYCRSVTTAQLMDFGPAIELDQGITFFVYDELNRCDHAHDFINQAPAVGTNTALIGHAGFFVNCPILGQLQMSEAAIFKPDGQGGSTFITRVTWDQWASLP
jgi:hypothetical protein